MTLIRNASRLSLSTVNLDTVFNKYSFFDLIALHISHWEGEGEEVVFSLQEEFSSAFSNSFSILG